MRLSLLPGERDYIFKLIIKEYDKRNSLLKAGAGEKELGGNEKNIDGLLIGILIGVLVKLVRINC